MKEFVARFGSLVTGVLCGFDRLVFRGTLQRLFRPVGLDFFLKDTGIRSVDFKAYAVGVSERIRQAAHDEANELHRPSKYLESAKLDKELVARQLLAQHPVEQGLICLFSVVEPCLSFEYRMSPDRKQRGFRLCPRKCLHLYKYFLHPRFGFMNARIQTWFPFNIQICLNGREWLAGQLQREGSEFKRVDNCFTWLEAPELAQQLADKQLETNWPQELGELALQLNPLHPAIFEASPMQYYWSAYQTEWATDLLFQKPQTLAKLYPILVHHAVTHFQSPDVMRFLGRKLNGNFTGELTTRLNRRLEGVRVKHYVRGNSVKMYDKAGSVLRIETTIQEPADFKVLRPLQGDPKGTLDWQPLRKGVADLHRRAQVSQRSNDEYLQALAAVDDSTPCSKLFDSVARPVFEKGRRFRALRLGDPADLALLQAISRGEFAVSGFRNRDIRQLLHPLPAAASERDVRRVSAKTSRQLRLLRAHGIIKKIQKTHRYRLTRRGQLLTAALSASRSASIKQLLAVAA